MHIRDEMRHGQLDSALSELDTEIAAYQAKDPEWAARFRVVKARLLMNRGSYSESLQLVSASLPSALQRTEAEVEREMVQGLDYSYLQQLDAADRSIAQAEALGASIQSSLVGSVAQSRGMLEEDRRNYDKAAAAFRQAALFGREHNQPRTEMDGLGNLGLVAMWQEHYDEAIDRFQEALTRSRALAATDAESRSLGNLGWSHWVIGDFDAALQDLTLAQEKAAQAGLIEDQTYWLVARADVETMQYRYAEADATARRALALAEKHDDQRTLASCLEVLARVALAMDHLDDADQFNRRAAGIARSNDDQSSLTDSDLIAGRIAAAKRDYPAALALFRRVVVDPKTETRLKWEAHTRLAEIYALQRQPGKAEQEFGLAVGMVQNARTSIQKPELRLSFLSSAIEFYDAYVNFLIGQHRPLDALKIADRSRSESVEQSLSAPGKSVFATARFANPRDTARSRNATLLFYWLGRQKSWLWVVTPANISLLPLPPAGELQGLVDSYRRSFIDDPRDPLEAGNADGEKLYATLIQPAEKLIGENSRVVILPDGSLNSLNFETLIVSSPQAGKKLHYWIEDATVLTANSLSLLSRSTAAAPPRVGNMLMVGEALAASPDFPSLPDAGKEVGLLEKYFGESQRVELTGKNATATAFLASQPEKFSYLHFATHGTASQLRPLESAVILSPDKDSYKLYARDVVQHPLKAYLVTISACNGAGTKTYAGEGLVGLSWAFLRAGAHNVIAGLWEVSNTSTPQLMDELYKGIHEGDDPATALRKAKLMLLHSTGNYRKPFYWAPFLIYAGS